MHTDKGQTLANTERYSIRRRLGAGGMGVVYEAFDRERDQVVALKTLRWADADAIYRFKREFRSLLDVQHPNLVTLYEMSARDDEWFFTMECVDGVDFLQYVRSAGPAESNAKTSPPDVKRLRSALRQLAQGLYTLHRAGKVHQDIKPTNVLVTNAGRVVILDFGLTADTTEPAELTGEAMWGTAGYMAPEHGNGPPGPAADWYAVGTMLYEALAGRPPYRGGPSTILYTKWKTGTGPPERPDQFAEDLPPDLVDLCMDLLSVDPSDRPDGLTVLERLGIAPSERQELYVARSERTDELVGRSRELTSLWRAFESVRTGRAAAAFVTGPSGIGKTALVSRFISETQRRAGTIVLSGRCYPKEAVPDKALDGVLDSLGAYLKGQPADQVAAMLPEGIADLVNVFSVLRRVPAIATSVTTRTPTGDRSQVRERGFAALRDLLRGIGLTRPLIVSIDDLQRTDNDGVGGLLDLLRPPHTPPLLLIASFRDGWTEADRIFSQLHDWGIEAHRIGLQPLDERESIALATVLLPSSGHAAALAPDISTECAGNPFLIEQLVRYLSSERHAPAMDVHTILQKRLGVMTGTERRFLEVVAVAGHPLETRLVRDIADIQGDEREVVATLEVAGFVRTDDAQRVETFHDRIREAVLESLADTDVQDLHRNIADTMRGTTEPVPELLFEHYLRAGKNEIAGNYAQQAASRAAAEFDFDRAERFYARALALRSHSPTSRARLLTARAQALSASGRLSEAADVFLEAAAHGGESERLENQRLGVEHLLLSGRIEQGLAELATVLRAAQLSLAESKIGSLASLLWSRAKLRVRMATRRIRIAPDPPRTDLLKVDVCRSVAEGLAHLEYVRAADYQARHVYLALGCGDADRIARALAIEAGFSVLHGGRLGYRRGMKLLQRAEALAARTKSQHALALCTLMSGTIAYFGGEWVRARELTARAQRQLSDHGSGVAWEVMTSQLYHTLSLYYSGDLRTLVTQATGFLHDAEQRGNRFASTIVKTGPANVIWLVRDETESAKHALASALEAWPSEPFRTPHYLALTADARIRLYEGNGPGALQVVLDQWPKLRATGLLRIQVIRVIMKHLRAACILAAQTGDPVLLRQAKQDATRIRREGRQWCHGLALSIDAGIAAAEGQFSRAAAGLRESIVALDRADMTLHVHSARHKLAVLLGGDEGRELQEDADRWMRAEGVRQPDRMADMVVPGFQP